MAGRVAYYGGIVKDGLVLDLDAAKKESYPGSGTTWFDVSGNNNHFTLYNGVSFDSLNGGNFSFDGTNDYARSQNTINLSACTGITLQAVSKATNLAMLYEHSLDWNSYPGAFGLSTNSDGYVYTSQSMHFYWNTNNGTSQGARNFTTTNQSSSFFIEHKTLIKNNSDGLQDYFNGNRVTYASPWGSGTSTIGNTTNFRNDHLYLGSRGGTVAFLQGNIAGILLYNRPLLAAEITQNYNALKGRYGL